MRPAVIALSLLALVALCGCQGERPTNSSDSTATAPKEGAPREKVAIEAPAGGSSTAAKVKPAGESPPKPQPADPSRTYEEGVTERALGMPFYPGSEELRPGGRYTDSSGTAAQSFRKTRKPVSDVIAFYRKHLDVVLHEIVDASSTTLVGEKDGMHVTVVAVRNADWTEVSVFTKRATK